MRERAPTAVTRAFDKGSRVVRIEIPVAAYAAEKRFAAANGLRQRTLRVDEDAYVRESMAMALTLEKRANGLREAGREREPAEAEAHAARIRRKSQQKGCT